MADFAYCLSIQNIVAARQQKKALELRLKLQGLGIIRFQ